MGTVGEEQVGKGRVVTPSFNHGERWVGWGSRWGRKLAGGKEGKGGVGKWHVTAWVVVAGKAGRLFQVLLGIHHHPPVFFLLHVCLGQARRLGLVVGILPQSHQ